MRGELEVGAVRLINKHLQNATNCGVTTWDLATAFAPGEQVEANIASFCQRMQVTREELIAEGREALRLGVSRFNTPKQIEAWEGATIEVFHRVYEGWARVDGTVQRGDADDARRYAIGPPWESNSCAIDTTLFCALQLNIGRCQIDQLAPHLWASLSDVSRALRGVVGRPWGLLNNSQTAALRDLLARALELSNPVKYKRGDYININDVIQTVCEGAAQLSWTEVRASQCECLQARVDSVQQAASCHVAFIVTGTEESYSEHSAEADAESLAAMINRLLRPRPLEKTLPCATCKGQQSRLRLILDRLPPTLYVDLPEPVTPSQDLRFKLFDEMTVVYWNTRGQQTVTYEPVGCVIMVNGNHFTARWRHHRSGGDDGIVAYDGVGVGRGKVVPRKGWWEGVPTTAAKTRAGGGKTGVVGMFYRQKEP